VKKEVFMKICHITTVHPRYDIRIFWKECVSIAKEGNEVILIVNDDQDNEETNGIKVISVKSPYKNRILRILSKSAKKKVYKKAMELKADIYHFHDPELLGLGIKLKKQGHCVIYDSHEDVPRQILAKEWMPRFIRRIVSEVFELYENRCVKKFDAIIVPTPHIKERFKHLNNSVWEICNFPSLEEINYSGDNYSNCNPACYVGDLSNRRGIKQIAEAAYKTGLKLNLCGKFHSTGLDQELNEKYNNVRYLGFLGRTDISEILSNSSMGFVTILNTPNAALSYPIKLFEYMAAGIPVISSDFPLYKEIIEGNNCGICVNPTDIQAITEAIIYIKEHQEEALLMGKNGRHAIEQKYNWSTQEEKLLNLYSHLLNQYEENN